MDRNIYCISTKNFDGVKVIPEFKNVDAVGIRHWKNKDQFVGFYFYSGIPDGNKFIEKMINEHGTEYVEILNLLEEQSGLYCRFKFNGSKYYLKKLSDKAKDYFFIHDVLIELATEDPELLITLDYDAKNDVWGYESVLEDQNQNVGDSIERITK